MLFLRGSSGECGLFQFPLASMIPISEDKPKANCREEHNRCVSVDQRSHPHKELPTYSLFWNRLPLEEEFFKICTEEDNLLLGLFSSVG